jgi:hypothetical protein
MGVELADLNKIDLEEGGEIKQPGCSMFLCNHFIECVSFFLLCYKRARDDLIVCSLSFCN